MAPDAVNITLIVFGVVYLGMIIGRWPFFQLDRTGIALLGAIVLVVFGVVDEGQALASLDLPTLLLLFAFMVISAQLRLGGFYSRIGLLLLRRPMAPSMLLAATILLTGFFSAIFTNDIICLAMAPVLLRGCRELSLNAVPFLLAVACSANIGSAATLIGNPQNILIGQALSLSFGSYLRFSLAPVTFSLILCWLVISTQYRNRFTVRLTSNLPQLPPPVEFDAWQATKGLAITGLLLVCFLFLPWPRELVALTGCGMLLLSRRMRSRQMLGLVDWQLLVLFGGLFVINGALQATGLPDLWLAWLIEAGFDLRSTGWLMASTLLLSNLVSNVPAVMLLLPVADAGNGGLVLALVSTFAGNLLIVGSIANIIVADCAEQAGIPFGWRLHLRTGLPVTLLSLLVAAGWLYLGV